MESYLTQAQVNVYKTQDGYLRWDLQVTHKEVGKLIRRTMFSNQ